MPPEAQTTQQNNQQGATGAGAAAATQQGQQGAQQGAKVDSWQTKTLTRDDLRNHGTIKNFKSADDFAASYISLEKKLGDQGRISIPGPEATDEQRAEFYKSLGRPDAPDKYTIGGKVKELLPEGSPVNEPFVKAAFETFHKAGMNDAQATAVVSFFAEQQASAMQAEQAAIIEGVNAIKTEWGHAYEEKLAVAGRAVDQLSEGEHAIPGLAELMDPEKGDPRFGSNPVLIRLFNWLGTLMGEDKLVEGNQLVEEQVTNLQERKRELMKPAGPYWNGMHPDHAKAIQDVAKINDQLTGGAQ